MDNVTVTDDSYKNTIPTFDIALTFISAFLSINGAFVLFVAHYLFWKNGRLIDESRNILIYLTFADLMVSIGHISSLSHLTHFGKNNNSRCDEETEHECVGQSFVTTLFNMSSFFWTTCIAFHLFWTYGDDSHRGETVRRTIIYHTVSWGVPAFITTIAYGTNALGSDVSFGTGVRCWISSCLSNSEKTFWMFISGKGWEILMYITCLACYLLLKWRKHKHKIRTRTISQTLLNSSTKRKNPPSEDIRFSMLWLIEISLRIFGTVRFLVATVKRDTGMKLPRFDSADSFFLHLQSFGDTAQAFCSCLLFVIFDRETRCLLKKTFYCRRHNNELSKADVPLLQTKTAVV